MESTTAEARLRASTARLRRAALAAALLAPVVTGCGGGGMGMASLKPSNPFSKSDESVPSAVVTTPSEGTEGKLASFGKSAKGTLAKTTGAVSGMFKRDADIEPKVVDDPLSLDNSPQKVDPKVYVANGQLWESTGKVDKAVESYNLALKQDPNNVAALSNLARLNYRQANFPVAAELFQKALAQSPNDAQMYNELGLTLHKLGRTDMAITVMQRALTISPENSRFANNLASVMHESGNPAGAYEVLVKNNKPAVAHFNMAYLQYKSGNVADARRHLDETMKFDTASNGDATVARAVARSKDMLAQMDTLAPAGTRPASTPNAVPAAAPPAITGGTPALTAGTKPAATDEPTSANDADARVATNPSPAARYGWPAAVAPASTSSAEPNKVNTAAATASPTDAPGTAPIPAWLKQATAATTADGATKRPTRVEAPSTSGFQLPPQ